MIEAADLDTRRLPLTRLSLVKVVFLRRSWEGSRHGSPGSQVQVRGPINSALVRKVRGGARKVREAGRIKFKAHSTGQSDAGADKACSC